MRVGAARHIRDKTVTVPVLPLVPPPPRQVTMTDLPEALPILRHNTDATFGHSGDDVGGDCSDRDGTGEACHGRTPLAGRHAKRPTIRQLSWGDPVEAAEVASAAAAAVAKFEGSEWRGFDLIVVRLVKMPVQCST